MDPDRPETDWEARVAKAKRDGGWYGPDEEPSPYPPRVKRVRFLTAFALTLLASVVFRALFHFAFHRPGSPVSTGVLFDGLTGGVLPAVLMGWTVTRPPRKKVRRTQ